MSDQNIEIKSEEINRLKLENAILRILVRWYEDQARLWRSKAGAFGSYAPQMNFNVNMATRTIVKVIRDKAVKSPHTAQQLAENMVPELYPMMEFNDKGKLLDPWWIKETQENVDE